MKLYRSHLVLVALLLLPTFALVAAGQEFDKARDEINNAKPNINYTAFCSEQYTGGDKLACRIRDVPSVGFLVCKTTEYQEGDETFPCKDVLETELQNINNLTAAGIKTVTVAPDGVIEGVRCGVDDRLNCSGFMEGWVDAKVGQFQQVRDYISNDTVGTLITEVKKFTTSGLSKTASDLEKIVEYMKQSEGEYRQICDLKGFFLINGGFLVGDTPSIDEEMAIDQTCRDGEPTTKQVLDALNTMNKAFSQDVSPIPTSGLPTIKVPIPTSGLPTIKVPWYFIMGTLAVAVLF